MKEILLQNLSSIKNDLSLTLKEESVKSLCGPCPKCGGKDRFVLKTDGNERCWCRSCHPEPIVGKIDYHIWKNFGPEYIDNSYKDSSGENGYKKLCDLYNIHPAKHQINSDSKNKLFSFFCDKRKISKQTIENSINTGNIKYDLHCNKKCAGMLFKGIGVRQYYQYITLDGSNFPVKKFNTNKLFPKGSESGQDGFFQVGQHLKEANQIIIVESAINALSGVDVIPEACWIALGSTSYYKKLSLFTNIVNPHAEIILFHDNDESGRKLISNTNEFLCKFNYKSVVWSSEYPDNYDVNDLLKENKANIIKDMIDKAKKIPEPMPLEINDLEANTDYPVDALPDTIKDAVIEIESFMQAPIALIASSAISATSLACQQFVNTPSNIIGEAKPVSLYFLTLAESGERKTSCDNLFFKPIKNFEIDVEEDIENLKVEKEAEIKIWKLKMDSLHETLKKDLKNSQQTPETEKIIKDLKLQEPSPVSNFIMIRQDETSEHLAYSLKEENPSVGIISNEAGMIFGSYGMKDDNLMNTMTRYNSYWEGSGIQVGRRQSESFVTRNVRVTIGWMVQPDIMEKFFKKHPEILRGSGFMSRFLMSFPPSTQGYRPYKRPPKILKKINFFSDKIKRILAKIDIQDRKLNSVSMTLTDGAFYTWEKIYNDIEKRLRPGGDLFVIKDFASKAPENILRLACLFSYFDTLDNSVQVTVYYIEQASKIIFWHLTEAKRITTQMDNTQKENDQIKFLNYINKLVQEKNKNEFEKRFLNRNGPIRGKKFNEILLELENKNILSHFTQKRKAYIRINLEKNSVARSVALKEKCGETDK
jgi:putative DNA primase/helicase